MTNRQAAYPIHSVFTDRWSPRAFDAKPISQDQLMTLLEAARWAPSSFNFQPWRIVYAHRNDANWATLLAPLIPFNQMWAGNASVLMYFISDTLTHTGNPKEATASHSHSFDVGAAWAQLGLQATHMGLYAHGMTGVDFDAARTALKVPDRFRIEAAVAVGHKADPSVLLEGLRDKEVPSDRKPIAEFAFAGTFPVDG
ncbi:MAG: nitroreductase family protein [Sphingobium sp.]